MAKNELPNIHQELETWIHTYGEQPDEWLLDRYLMYTNFLDNGDRNGQLMEHHARKIGKIVTCLDFELKYRYPDFGELT